MKKLLLILALSAIILSCQKDNSIHKVIISATCAASNFDLKYVNEKGETIETIIFEKTWSYEFKAETGTYLYIWARSRTRGASMTVNIEDKTGRTGYEASTAGGNDFSEAETECNL